MSDIPKARRLVAIVAAKDTGLSETGKGVLKRALRLMYREKYFRRAPAQRQVINSEVRTKIRRLATTDRTLTQHQIANRVGLRSSGRISEVLNGKR